MRDYKTKTKYINIPDEIEGAKIVLTFLDPQGRHCLLFYGKWQQ